MAELRRMARALSRGGNGPWVANRTALRSTTSTPVHLVEVPPPHRRALGIEDDVEGVLDILGAERGPVVELDVTPEVEDVRRHVRQVPPLGERGDDPQAGVEGGQPRSSGRIPGSRRSFELVMGLSATGSVSAAHTDAPPGLGVAPPWASATRDPSREPEVSPSPRNPRAAAPASHSRPLSGGCESRRTGSRGRAAGTHDRTSLSCGTTREAAPNIPSAPGRRNGASPTAALRRPRNRGGPRAAALGERAPE